MTEATSGEKAKAIESAVLQIERQFGKGSIMRLGQHATLKIAAIPTGSLADDYAIVIGGVPRGRVVEIFGPESSGKTTLALSIVGRRSKAPLSCHSVHGPWNDPTVQFPADFLRPFSW